jgi:alcohol dehydrogenase class IV
MSENPAPFPVRPFVGPGRVLFGAGAAASAGTELRTIGVDPASGPVLVVADAVLLDLGLVDPIVAGLAQAGFEVRVGPGVAGEPTPDTVEAVLAVGAGDPIAAVLGVGGGSALDASKLVAAAATNTIDLTAGLPATAELGPVPILSAIPTTAGTGAETTAVAMLWHERRKRIFVHDRLVPRHAILDPTLLAALPKPVMAASGLDAISHAIESLLSTFRTPMTAAAGQSALRRLAAALPVACSAPDEAVLGEMLLGASEAGLGLNASVVVGHSIAYAVASRTGLSHGVTCAMALPYCLAYSRSGAEAPIAALGPLVGTEATADAVLSWLTRLTASLDLPASLDAVGIAAGELPGMAAEIAQSYPRPNSPVALEPAALERLLGHFHSGDVDAAWSAFATAPVA